MLGQPHPAPSAVYLLADHLDAVLAGGEDLLKLRFDPWTGGTTELRRFVEQARMLELTVAGRALQARARARDLAGDGDQFRALTSLFAAGLTPLQDALDELADASGADFDTGEDPVAYLRSRGVLDSETASVAEAGQVGISDNFLIAGHIGLGPLLDLAATFLDVLESHYDLFEDSDQRPVTSDQRPSALVSDNRSLAPH